MFALVLVFLATFFSEIGDSIGKKQFQMRALSVYELMFLSAFASSLLFLATVLFIPVEYVPVGLAGDFIFSSSSLPTFGVRVLLELLQVHLMALALIHAQRSVYAFFRVATLPLLLLVDVFLGYSIGSMEIAGIILVITTLIVIRARVDITKKGLLFVLLASINAVATISLLKYNITYHNSVTGEQLTMSLILFMYVTSLCFFSSHRNPFILLTRPKLLTQSVAIGVGGVLISFAYVFAASSVVATAQRAIAVFWALLFGYRYFGEAQFKQKVISFIVIAIGLLFLAF